MVGDGASATTRVPLRLTVADTIGRLHCDQGRGRIAHALLTRRPSCRSRIGKKRDVVSRSGWRTCSVGPWWCWGFLGEACRWHSRLRAALGAALDVIVVRKLGVPWQPELAMGAIGEDGVRVINDEIVRITGVSNRELATVEACERAELERRARRFRGSRPREPLEGRTVVIVDDGIATGSTARAACHVARAQGAARVVLAVPVAPPDWTSRFDGDADELIALETPEPFYAVGQAYRDFSQTTDIEVLEYLDLARQIVGASPGAVAQAGTDDDPPLRDDDVVVTGGGLVIEGHLTIPERPLGVVLFAHGSGSSRHSPRNRYVASVLHQARVGTLLFDLLTTSEERDRANVFDIDLLGRRLLEATRWVRSQPETAGLPIGYFGASTGAAAALWAAASPEPASLRWCRAAAGRILPRGDSRR